MTDSRAYLEDVLAKAEDGVVEAAMRAHVDDMRSERQSAPSEMAVDMLRGSSFAIGAYWALSTTSPAMARALVAVLEVCDRAMAVKVAGSTEDDRSMAAAASVIIDAITTELAKEV